MKNKYILFILFLTMVIVLPYSVKASKTCAYVGRTSNKIEIVSANDSNNHTAISVIVDDIAKRISIPGMTNVGNNYSIFKSSCPERIYLCMHANMGGMSYGIFTPNDVRSCNSYTNLVLKNSSSGSGSAGRNGDSSGYNGYDRTEHYTCRYLFGDPEDSKYIAYWLQWTMNLIKYLGIIALFVMSTVDFVKALVQHDQDALKKAATTSVKRFIFCVLLFFLPIIVDTLMSFLGAYGTCNIG